ncbi:MAG: phospholipid carrier-dependent glycosyltransferase [Oscillospiraceae bacterium]|nr:phospholipid carrier-dependent glycosyltransferase [Oscillospiraceae bacterium]
MTKYFIIITIYCVLCVCGFASLSQKTDDKKVVKGKKPQKPAQKTEPKKRLWFLLLAAFGLRAFFALQDVGFWFDVNCFKSWADATAYYGLNGMYHSGMFLDYPPGYMYVLALTNIIQTIFNLDYYSVIYTFIIKLPAILTDLAGACLIYKMADEKLGEKWALFLCGCYAFGPGIIFTSSIWGQIDSFYTLLMVLALYCISKDDVVKAAVVYAMALITKPQALLFGPVLLFWVISKKDWKIFFKAVGIGLCCMWLFSLPFGQSLSPLWLINLYKNTFNGYRYFTVNGYNLYMLAGLNWKPLANVPGAESINTVVILVCFAFCAFAYFRQKDSSRIFNTALVFITVFFSFCTMMHERYMHPAIILSLISFVLTKNKAYFAVFLTASASNYLNVAASMASQYFGVEIAPPVYSFISILSVACCIMAIITVYTACEKIKTTDMKAGMKEALAVGGLCLVYGAFAFFRLGASQAPESFYQANRAGEWFVYRFDQPAHVSQIWSYSGMGDQYYPDGDSTVKKGCEFEILAVSPDGLWENMADLHHDYVFTWSMVETDFYADSVMVRAKEDNQILSELVLKDRNGETIRGSIETGASFIYQKYSPYNALDESHMVPITQDSYYWSMYFDEVYHGRTAFEQLHSYTIYETTHPPLGKTIISIGIALFGMNPFGWRCMGALAGVIMVWIMYLLAKELFGNVKAAWLTAFVFAFDFMHYTQTRIATVDSYVVLFTMLMFLFMIRFARIPLAENTFSQLFNLFMSGLFMGCAIAVKWNGAYGVIGLAAYFFVALFIKNRDYITLGGDKKEAIKKSALICLWCVICFIIIPCGVYFASFAPVLYTEGVKQTVQTFINKQIHMFNYHSQLVAEHFFSSLWYTWPVIIKPIWYSVSRFGDKVSSISAFGNPAVWLPMLPALIYVLYKGAKEKDRSVPAIVLGYLGCLLPWVAITRLTFIYHYFPATVFGTLAIGYVINQLLKNKKAEKHIWVYPAVVFALFVIFFPVISGLPASANYVDALELLDTWYFN